MCWFSGDGTNGGCSTSSRLEARTVNVFIAYGSIPVSRGLASCRPPRSWPLGRRSGRVPAWPYPPPSPPVTVTQLAGTEQTPTLWLCRTRWPSACARFSRRATQIGYANHSRQTEPLALENAAFATMKVSCLCVITRTRPLSTSHSSTFSADEKGSRNMKVRLATISRDTAVVDALAFLRSELDQSTRLARPQSAQATRPLVGSRQVVEAREHSARTKVRRLLDKPPQPGA